MSGVGRLSGAGPADGPDGTPPESASAPALESTQLGGDATLRDVAAGRRTLASGSRGPAVRKLQEALLALHQPLGAADGSFGPKTRAALMDVQAVAGLRKTGVLDAATIAALDERLVAERNPYDDVIPAPPAAPVPAPAPPRGPAPGAAPTPYDTDWFTDADALPTPDVRPPVADPESAPRTTDSVDGPPSAPFAGDPAAAFASAGFAVNLPGVNPAFTAERQRLTDQVAAAVAGDPAAAHAFARLVQSGRLSQDVDLLPNLAALAARPRDPRLMLDGIDPKLVLSEAIRAIDDPLRIQQGAGHGTCGAGTLEYLLVKGSPAEFVRLVDGLTAAGSNGEVAMRSGAKLALPSTAIERDASGRVDLDRLLQSAFMERATAMGWLFDYDNQRDDGTFWAQVAGDSGMPLTSLKNLYEDLTGGSFHAVSGLPEVSAERAVAASRAGARVPVELTFGGGVSSLHFLTLEKVNFGADGKPESVYLRNPWGKDSAAGAPPRWALPEGGGRIGMKYDDFVKSLYGVVVK